MQVKKWFFLFSVILLFAAFFTSCSSRAVKEPEINQGKPEKESREDGVKAVKPVLLFDLSHQEVFSPDDGGARGLLQARQVFEKAGYEVLKNEAPFTPETLKDANTVFIAGPMRELSSEEIDALKDFVNNGGNLLITVHVNFFVQELLDSFGFLITQGPVSEGENTFHENDKDFIAKDLRKHPISEGIDSVAFMGAYGVKGKDRNVDEIIFTSKNAWVDLNENGTRDKGDYSGKLCLLAAREFGKGKVVVVGDDAVFSNMLINSSGNKQLLQNIAEWFIGRLGKGIV